MPGGREILPSRHRGLAGGWARHPSEDENLWASFVVPLCRYA